MYEYPCTVVAQLVASISYIRDNAQSSSACPALADGPAADRHAKDYFAACAARTIARAKHGICIYGNYGPELVVQVILPVPRISVGISRDEHCTLHFKIIFKPEGYFAFASM